MSIAAYSSVSVSSIVVVTGLRVQPSQAVWIMTPAQEKPAARALHSSFQIQMTASLLCHKDTGQGIESSSYVLWKFLAFACVFMA